MEQIELVRKALVTLSIEQSLLEIGGSRLLNEVTRILYEKNQCYLSDCFDNPGNLRKVWDELDEGTGNVIVDLIGEKLADSSQQKSIGTFLSSLSRLKCMQKL